MHRGLVSYLPELMCHAHMSLLDAEEVIGDAVAIAWMSVLTVVDVLGYGDAQPGNIVCPGLGYVGN